MPITDVPASRSLRPSRLAFGIAASLVLHGAAVGGLVLWQASQPNLDLGRGGMQASWIELGELTLPPAPSQDLPATDEIDIAQTVSEPEPEPEPEPPAPNVKPEPKPQPKPPSRPTSKPKPAAADRAESRPGSTASVATAAIGTTAGKAASGPDPLATATIEQRYLSALQQAIARHRFYPSTARRDGVEGTVTVLFTIQADGRITGAKVAAGSGSALLDEAALETLSRLGRFRPIPAELQRERWPLRVPIRFALR